MARWRVLLISQYFPPDLTAAAFRLYETALCLDRLGFDVTILTAQPHRSQAKPGEREEAPDALSVIRAPILRIGDRGGVWYVVQFLSFMVSAVLWGLARTKVRFDFVVASSPPLFVGVSGWLLAMVKRGKLVMDIRDLWPDSAVATGQLPARGPLVALGQWLERFLYRRARLITCVAAPMKEIIAARVGGSCRVEVIYNGAVTGSMRPEKRLQQSGTDQRLTITYAGNVGRSQGLEILVNAAAHFPDITFEIIGSGVRHRAVRALAASKGLQNVFFTGPLSKAETSKRLARASALFLQLRDEPVFSTTIPSKVFDYLVADRPIIFGLRGEGADILSGLPGNVGFEPENLGSLVAAVEQLASNHQHYALAAMQNSAAAQAYSREEMTGKLARLLGEI